MVFVGNDNQEFLCHPDTGKPYRFETEEQADYMIRLLNLDGAKIVEVPDTEEERYGGQNDLW